MSFSLNSYAKLTFISLSLSLTACQTLQPIQPTIHSQEQVENFAIQGKIGIRTPEQTNSAFYTWIQQNEQYSIELSGILGIGLTQINGDAQQVSLTNAQVGTITAPTAEELLKQATGWIAPISNLKFWIQAQARHASAQVQYDTQQRPTIIVEDDWQVELDYNDLNTKPYRLILTQTIENNKQNRITMIIQNR
ncbi:lipoprotein insertase outer membrane protein LolB [Moraxella sp. ZY210820]|uniref:lipoprotein insertase outer membrane protein LolB n=1 Tax=unclassified Moraxella TaxID=2685852 RepID=UPI0027307DA7|nr:lipoprotein insertase outer membrane protein LolB [Moraxella sp. ZY210820]WLF84729.1 lipoprotein insertase outer membrane protein LolB [Moraxella sp. ZY210820]